VPALHGCAEGSHVIDHLFALLKKDLRIPLLDKMARHCGISLKKTRLAVFIQCVHISAVSHEKCATIDFLHGGLFSGKLTRNNSAIYVEMFVGKQIRVFCHRNQQNIANGFPNAVHRLHQGVLYLLSITRYHGTRNLWPQEKYHCRYADFHEVPDIFMKFPTF
jgi:hypothetical protein